MYVYKVVIGNDGEIVLPRSMMDLLALNSGDSLELVLDYDGKIVIHVAKRASGPLADFFEDLILNDLYASGYIGDLLKAKLLDQKVQLSTVLDRLSQEAMFLKQQGNVFPWREELTFQNEGSSSDYLDSKYQVILCRRAEREFNQLPSYLSRELSQVFSNLEKDPFSYKRLRGPYYETYRIYLQGEGTGHYRVIYSVFPNLGFVAILCIGDRREIYENLKTMIKTDQHKLEQYAYK